MIVILYLDIPFNLAVKSLDLICLTACLNYIFQPAGEAC